MHGRAPLAALLALLACGDGGAGTDAPATSTATTTAADTAPGDPTGPLPTTDGPDVSTSSTGPGAGDTTGDTGDEPVEPPVTVSRGMGDDLVENPQYLAVRKSATEGIDAAEQPRCEALLPGLVGLPFVGNSHTCVIFAAYMLDVIPDQAVRRQVFRQGFEEARVVVGAEAIGERRLAVEITVNLLDDTPERVEVYFSDLLHAAREARLPVLINLDAVNWWGGRPDLWNFHDPNRPGFDPANLDNVEWVGPGPDGAPTVYWRNWGAQIRVETPVPNLGGPGLRAAIHDVLTRLGPHLRGLIDGLAPDERHLYAGTIIGTELSIGVNHYHYPGGNAFLGAPPGCDPGLPLAPGCPGGGACPDHNQGVCPPDFFAGLSGGVAQLGWHAALDLGLLTPDQPMTQAVNDEILRSYISFFDGELQALGVPRTTVFSHTGGVFGPAGPQSLFAARTGTAIPGWSMYYEGPADPSIGAFTDSSDAQKVLPWASPEWLPLDPGGVDPASTWRAAIEANLNFRNNRMLSLANWEGVAPNPDAVAGLRDALTAPTPDACVVAPRVLLGAADFGDTVGVRFSRRRGDTVTYLNASSDPTQSPGGGFVTIDIANEALADQTSWFFTHDGDAQIYVQLVTDGCARDGAVQRMFSEVLPLVVHGQGAPPAGPRLYTAPRGAMQLFAWDADPQAGPARLQVARDPEFTDLLLDEDVTPHQVYARDGFAAGRTYHARLTAGDVPSNAVAFAR